MEIYYLGGRTLGVYWDRIVAKNMEERRKQIIKEPEDEDVQDAEELKKKLEGVYVTLSPEGKEHLANATARKEAAKAEMEKNKTACDFFDFENPFEISGKGNIWSQHGVLTRELEKQGFYKDMSDEKVKELEDLLGDISYGMDSINERPSSVFPKELSSYEAKFELESSTAALRQFSEQFVPASIQASFQELVDQYYEYNSKVLETYISSRERSNESSAKLYERTSSQRVIPIDEEEKMQHLSTKVKRTQEEEDTAAAGWEESFKRLKEGKSSISDFENEIGNILQKYAAGNIENKIFYKYLNQWHDKTIDRAVSYWSKIV